MFYLYVKTHKDTGLKYLGQTSRDPYTYKGSGKRWTNHINKHGNNVVTEILFETNDRSKLQETGLYYSRKFDIVNRNDWANIVEESGTGGDTSSSPAYINGIKNRDFSKKRTPESRENASEKSKKVWREKFNSEDFDEAEYKRMCSERSQKMWRRRGISEDERKERALRQKEYMKNPEVRENLSKKAKEAWRARASMYEVRFPDGSIETVESLRGWCKDNGHPYYKLYTTIRANRPSPDGWFVKKLN